MLLAAYREAELLSTARENVPFTASMPTFENEVIVAEPATFDRVALL
jgi:hypothetical protein